MKQVDPGEDDDEEAEEEEEQSQHQQQQQVSGDAVEQVLMTLEVLHHPDVPLGMSIAGGSRTADEVFPASGCLCQLPVCLI